MEIEHYETNINKFVTNDDGSLLIPGVKLMAAGTWHASNAMSPMRYGNTVLKNFSDNWSDTSVWSTHDQARSVTKKVGNIQNPRFDNDACVGDVLLHGGTQESRDSINLIINNQIDSVSSEIMITQKSYCSKNKVDNAEKIEFVGLALVSEGACKVCKLHSDKKESENMTESEITVTELAAKLDELVAKIEAAEKPAEEDPAKEVPAEEEEHAENSEFKEQIVQLNTVLSDLTARMEKMEAVPVVLTNMGKPTEPEKKVNPFE